MRTEQERQTFEQTKNRLTEGADVGGLEAFDPNMGRPSGSGVKPADLVGSPLLVKVVKYTEQVNTSYGPKNAVDVDIAGVSNGKVERGLRWFNPAVVDALQPYEGKVIPLKLAWSTGNSGRAYISAESLSEIETKAANVFYAKGDPFAAEGSQAPWAEPEQKPAEEEKPRW